MVARAPAPNAELFVPDELVANAEFPVPVFPSELSLFAPELCRKHGISEATYYNWKSKYSGMTVNELRRLKELEYENARLKKMYADLSLEHEVVKDLLSKKF